MSALRNQLGEPQFVVAGWLKINANTARRVVKSAGDRTFKDVDKRL